MAVKDLVLVAEDNAINRKLLGIILKAEYTVVEAEDGQAALAMLERYGKEITALILDLRMPRMDGIDVLHTLTGDSRYADLPILIATGTQDAQTEKTCLELGAWDFVTKPYDPAILLLRLRNIIGRRKGQLLDQIRIIAQYDRLTGLYNRDYFLAQAKKLLYANPAVDFALVRMDIDRFRQYNASFGKAAGDELLQKMADQLRARCGAHPNCVYGRMESDVFCICLPYREQELHDAMQRAAAWGRSNCKNYRLEFSFGVYVVRSAGMDLEKAYSYASEAAQKCKTEINCAFSFFDDAMLRRQRDEQQIANEMEAALEQHQFRVYLQPKYSLRENRSCGAEALVRWMHPQRGMISPGMFIPLFEQNGFIVQLDHFMWQAVCLLLRDWIARGKPVDPVSVNVSRISLYDPGIVEDLVRMTDACGIPRALLQLEVTESAYMSNPELMKTTIAQLRGRGFTILMDDFGSGYSSLNTLKDIEVDILKTDMKFLPTGGENVKSEKILTSIVRMAGWLGMPVVVEGVETRAQRDFLASIGCDYVQGFFYARPMPQPDYEDLIFNRNSVLPHRDEPNPAPAPDGGLLWSADSRVGTLLKSVTVPFAIFETSPYGLSVLRHNEAYRHAFEQTGEQLGWLTGTEREKLEAALAMAAHRRGEATCDCLCVKQDALWYRVSLCWLQSAAQTDLVSATFTDITVERLLESELNKLFGILNADPGQRKTLLVVDDSQASREILRGMFSKDYEVLTASDGAEGLRLLKRNVDAVGLILLDMVMPGMSGQEFLARKEDLPRAAEVPVIVISGDSRAELQVHMLRAGVSDYIVKPFVAETVLRRVNNVLAYSTRLGSRLESYTNARQITERRALGAAAPGRVYTPAELQQAVDILARSFEVVRVVDPVDAAGLTVDGAGEVARQSGHCYGVWDKSERCQNCVGLRAAGERSAMAKFEFIGKTAFYVTAQPICLRQPDGTVTDAALEMVSRVPGRLMPKNIRGQSVRELLEATQSKIYSDSLTKVYNRRFYDEMLFVPADQGESSLRLGLILLDMCYFKRINDLFGHAEGDQVLAAVAAALRRSIRPTDALIRYGGDEFVVIMTDCAESDVLHGIQRLALAVRKVRYGPRQELSAQADFGYGYTENFRRSATFLAELFTIADQSMYHRKRQRQLEEAQRPDAAAAPGGAPGSRDDPQA